jgi:hypothetical protein
VHQGTSRRFGDRLGQAGRPPFGNDDSRDPGRVRRADNRSEVMRILNTVKQNNESASTHQILKVCVLRCRRMVGRDALVWRFAGRTIERSAVLVTDRDLPFFGEFNDLLNFGATQAFCDDYSFKGASGAKRFPDRMDSSENCHYNE